MTLAAQETLIGSAARELVHEDRAEVPLAQQQLRIWERARNLKTLERECDSWVRLGAGVLAWALGVAGAAGGALGLWQGAGGGARSLGLVAGVLLLAAAAALGLSVWRAGRAVVDAFCWWTLLPARVPDPSGTDWGRGAVYDAAQARLFMFRGMRLVRVVLAALAFLAPLVFLLFATGTGDGGQATRFEEPLWPAGQGSSQTVTTLLLFVVSWTAGAITMGGQVRANNANAQRDPVQSAVFRFLRRQ